MKGIKITAFTNIFYRNGRNLSEEIKKNIQKISKVNENYP